MSAYTTMLSAFAFIILIKFGYAQLNGEFWWLNEKLAAYNGVQPSPPMFENLSEFDTDENARIVFKDDNLITNDITTKLPQTIDMNKDIEKTIEEVINHNVIKWPDFKNKEDVSKNIDRNDITEQVSIEERTEHNDISDKFVFKFPDDDHIVWKDFPKRTSPVTTATVNMAESTNANTTLLYKDKVSFNMNYEEKHSESICTYMKKSECYRYSGLILNMKGVKEISTDQFLICCVLPLEHKEYDPSKIYYPDAVKTLKRPRRSKEDSVSQNQRKVILQHKYAHQRIKPKLPIPTKIASPDYDYDDPYWNIKTVKNGNNKKQESSTIFDYGTEDYFEDYAAEIPRPGLTGLYSDHGQRPSTWGTYKGDKGSPYGGTDDYDDNDSESFGYSTIDPRLGTTFKSKRGRPQKLTTSSDEVGYNAESYTISYHANPDFHVLQNFKLLNLMRDKNRSPSKNSRTTTAETFSDDDSRESLLSVPFTSDEVTSEDFDDQQVFKGCGKAIKTFNLKNKGKQIGDAVNGSHPWLALVVQTRKQNSVLCYATLIHPRAAITAADCVQRQSAGDLTLITGLWNLNVRSRARSRVISVRLHPHYKQGTLSNNVAILHWKTPLRLGPNVQPACLANPRAGDECMFVGWGGFDQAIRPQSRWQRASIHTCRDRLSLNGVNIPDEAFCTSVQARSTVTGIGGSLICNVHGREAAVGVAVSRDSTLVMLPVFQWGTRAISVLQD